MPLLFEREKNEIKSLQIICYQSVLKIDEELFTVYRIIRANYCFEIIGQIGDQARKAQEVPSFKPTQQISKNRQIDTMASAVAAIHASNPKSVPGRIIIRGTSKLSLKDRFTRLSNEMQNQHSARHANEVAISAANKRLAQNLGNSPEVVSALRVKRRPVFQRLGVKTRLGIPNGFYQQQRNGFSPFRRGYRNYAGGQFGFGYYNNVGYRQPRNYGPNNNRFGSSPGGFGYRRGGFQKRFRGGGGGGWRFNRGGRGRQGGQQNERLSREELDRQLDEYMSKTKAHLDDELDVYMGDVKN